MGHRSRSAALAFTVVVASGCVPLGNSPASVVMNTLMLIVGATPKSAPVVAAAKRRKVTGQLTVATQVTIGGLAGTYDVTLGPYGQFSGTAEIVGRKAAKLTDDGSAGLLTAVRGILLDSVGADVTVTSARAKVSGRQTTGGVHKRYKGKIAFAGTLAGGTDAGAAVKGKIKTKGDLEA
jgi:hypothetical protein